MGRTIAIVNQKGGVGKTTTAINLSAGLAATEHPTLLVDLDPQSNASTGLGIYRPGLYPTVYQAILGKEEIQNSILSTEMEHLSLVPADIDLVGAEIELVLLERREFRLREELPPTAAKFDYVVVDCPPSLGLLTINALTAADSVLIPVQCEFYALEGVAKLLKTVRLVKERLNPALRIEGILLTMFDGRTTLATQVRDEVKRHFEAQLFETVIPRNVRLSEAPSHGKPIILYDLHSAGAVAYLRLTREVLAHE